MPKTKILVVALCSVGFVASLGAARAVQTCVTDAPVAATDPEPIGGKVGACIVPGNGHCAQVTELICLLINGEFLGPGSDCPPEPKDDRGTATDPEPVGGKVGACIVPGNGHCAQVSELVCLLINGDFLGPGSDCPPEPKDD